MNITVLVTVAAALGETPAGIAESVKEALDEQGIETTSVVPWGSAQMMPNPNGPSPIESQPPDVSESMPGVW